MSARDDVLSRIRKAVAGAEPAEDAPRDYRASYDVGNVVDHFADMVADYKATVRRVGRMDLAAVVAEEVGGRRVGVPAGLPTEWYAGIDAVVDAPPLSIPELDQLDGAVTGARLGIAETGTIVLDGGGRSGRRAITLVPDWHLCIVEASQVVGSVPQAVMTLEPRVPITFISGPSATSDIELNRVEGVHGPRTLNVLIVDD